MGKAPVIIPSARQRGSMQIIQEGERIIVLAGGPDGSGMELIGRYKWRDAEQLFKHGLEMCKQAEAYTWSLVEGKHVDPDFCKIKRVFDVPVLEERAELERLP